MQSVAKFNNRAYTNGSRRPNKMGNASDTTVVSKPEAWELWGGPDTKQVAENALRSDFSKLNNLDRFDRYVGKFAACLAELCHHAAANGLQPETCNYFTPAIDSIIRNEKNLTEKEDRIQSALRALRQEMKEINDSNREYYVSQFALCLVILWNHAAANGLHPDSFGVIVPAIAAIGRQVHEDLRTKLVRTQPKNIVFQNPVLNIWPLNTAASLIYKFGLYFMPQVIEKEPLRLRDAGESLHQNLEYVQLQNFEEQPNIEQMVEELPNPNDDVDRTNKALIDDLNYRLTLANEQIDEYKREIASMAQIRYSTPDPIEKTYDTDSENFEVDTEKKKLNYKLINMPRYFSITDVPNIMSDPLQGTNSLSLPPPPQQIQGNNSPSPSPPPQMRPPREINLDKLPPVRVRKYTPRTAPFAPPHRFTMEVYNDAVTKNNGESEKFVADLIDAYQVSLNQIDQYKLTIQELDVECNTIAELNVKANADRVNLALEADNLRAQVAQSISKDSVIEDIRKESIIEGKTKYISISEFKRVGREKAAAITNLNIEKEELIRQVQALERENNALRLTSGSSDYFGQYETSAQSKGSPSKTPPNQPSKQPTNQPSKRPSKRPETSPKNIIVEHAKSRTYPFDADSNTMKNIIAEHNKLYSTEQIYSQFIPTSAVEIQDYLTDFYRYRAV